MGASSDQACRAIRGRSLLFVKSAKATSTTPWWLRSFFVTAASTCLDEETRDSSRTFFAFETHGQYSLIASLNFPREDRGRNRVSTSIRSDFLRCDRKPSQGRATQFSGSDRRFGTIQLQAFAAHSGRGKTSHQHMRKPGFSNAVRSLTGRATRKPIWTKKQPDLTPERLRLGVMQGYGADHRISADKKYRSASRAFTRQSCLHVWSDQRMIRSPANFTTRTSVTPAFPPSHLSISTEELRGHGIPNVVLAAPVATSVRPGPVLSDLTAARRKESKIQAHRPLWAHPKDKAALTRSAAFCVEGEGPDGPQPHGMRQSDPRRSDTQA